MFEKKGLPLFAWISITLAFVWMVVYNLRPIQDPDIWWHLASGRYMWTYKTVPTVDVFSLSARGTPWINTYWLFDLISAAVYKLCGLPGITLGKAVLWASFPILYLRRTSRFGPWPSVLWGALWLFLGSHPRGFGSGEKASYVSLFFMAVLFYRFQTGEPRHKLDRWWPFLFLIWANLHRGFILGLFCMGLYALEDLWFKRPDAKRRIGMWTVCALATLLNPFGWKIFGMGWHDVSLSPGHVTGWAHTPFAHLEIFWVTLILFWVLYAWKLSTKKVDGWAHWGVSLFLTALSVRYASFYPYWMIWSVPWLINVFIQNSKLISAPKGAMVLVCFLGATLITLRPRWGINARIFPVQAAAFMKSNAIHDPVFHEYELGGFLMWAFEGDPPVLIDGRYPAVEGYRRLYSEIENATQADPKVFQTFLERYGIDTALVKYPSTQYLPAPFRVYFPKKVWSLVYWDDTALIFLRRGTPTQKRMRSAEFMVVEPAVDMSFWQKDVWARASSSQKRRIVEELRRNAAHHPESIRTRRWLELTGSLI